MASVNVQVTGMRASALWSGGGVPAAAHSRRREDRGGGDRGAQGRSHVVAPRLGYDDTADCPSSRRTPQPS
jgi:hypothetical protein